MIITSHKIDPANDGIQVRTVGPVGSGGAYHLYEVSDPEDRFEKLYLSFQDGPVGQNGEGVNGITQEVLLAVVADRLRSFQQGDYACRENALALTKVEEALHWLHHRTRDRLVAALTEAVKEQQGQIRKTIDLVLRQNQQIIAQCEQIHGLEVVVKALKEEN